MYVLQPDMSVSSVAAEHKPDSPLTRLARISRAIGSEPLFQRIDVSGEDDRREIWAAPIPWMFFGYYRAIKQPCTDARHIIDAPLTLTRGKDMIMELVSQHQIPCWAHNRVGNAYVPYLDVIRVTPINWDLWIDGCYMSAVRIGRSRVPKRRGSKRQSPQLVDVANIQRNGKRHKRSQNDEEGSDAL